MGFISSEIIAQIREQTDIVQVISEYVRLIPSGAGYKALCPFHAEKTPSFHIVADKQIYHCFGCGKGGDVFSFIMEIENKTFVEAVKMLAGRCRIAIPDSYEPEAEKKAGLYDLLEKTAQYYQKCLQQPFAEDARQYIAKRGLKEETVKTFMLGYAPNGWQSLVDKFSKSSQDISSLEKLCLIKPRKQGGGFYDVFRNRLMIPITDIHGRVAGFGGRVLSKDDEPKYLNSAESEAFVKRSLLFNFRNAIPSMRRLNSAVVVEGYLDVISLWQHGVKNVVAALGTAISPEQVNMLARNCSTVYFCYDADEAGQRAALRAISMQKDAPVNAKIVSFDDPQDDPDSFIIREGADNFKKLLEKAVDIYTFLVEARTRGLKRPFDVAVKQRLINEFKELVSDIQGSVARSEVIRKISRLLDVDAGVLEREFAGQRVFAGGELQKKGSVSVVRSADIQRQEWVLMHLLEHPENLDLVKARLVSEDFADPRLRKLYEALCFQQEACGGTLKPAEILASLDDAALASRLSELIATLGEQQSEPFVECVNGLVKKRLKHSLKVLQQQIREAESKGDDSLMLSLAQEQIGIKRKIDALN